MRNKLEYRRIGLITDLKILRDELENEGIVNAEADLSVINKDIALIRVIITALGHMETAYIPLSLD